MSQTFENKTLGTKLEIKDVTQGELEKWMASLRELQPKEASLPEYHGAILRAACQAGVLIDPALTMETVATLNPRVVRWYGLKLNSIFVELTTIPPD